MSNWWAEVTPEQLFVGGLLCFGAGVMLVFGITVLTTNIPFR